MAQKQRLVAGHHSRVAMADTEDDEECEEVDYRDYYDHLSQSEAIRPICITEGVDFDSMSLLGRIGWWIGSFFKENISKIFQKLFKKCLKVRPKHGTNQSHPSDITFVFT